MLGKEHNTTHLMYLSVAMGSESDDERFVPRCPAPRVRRAYLHAQSFDPFHILSDESDIERILDDLNESSDGSDDPIDLDYLEQLRGQRLRRSAAAYPYSGTLIKAVDNLHEDEVENWTSLNPVERERRWVAEFRMPEPFSTSSWHLCRLTCSRVSHPMHSSAAIL